MLAGVGMPYSLRPPVADMQTAPSSAPSAPSARRRAHVASFLCVVLGVALVLPSLTAGFFLDDYLQIAQLEGWSRVPAHPLDLFAFTPRDRGATDRLREAGVAPYFTAPGLRLAFLRPLSSALIWFDHAMFARAPLPYHVHSVLWYAALLVTVAVLLRKAVPGGGRMGTLALLIFCLDGGHALTVTFIAARNGAVSTTLVLLALLAHIRWRSDGWRAGAVIAPTFAALALAGGEMAFGGLAYIVAWEAVYRRPGWRKALAPTGVIALAYLAVYRLTASGARFSGAYLDPIGAPLDVLRAVPERALDLAGGLLLSSPVDFLSGDARLRLPLAGIGLIACVSVAVWLPGTLRRMASAGEDDQALVVRWMGWGAVGALLAGTLGLLGDRVLLAAGVGGAVVVAALLRDGWRLFRSRPSRGLAAIGLVLLGFPHLVLGAVALPGKVFLFRIWS